MIRGNKFFVCYGRCFVSLAQGCQDVVGAGSMKPHEEVVADGLVKSCVVPVHGKAEHVREIHKAYLLTSGPSNIKIIVFWLNFDRP